MKNASEASDRLAKRWIEWVPLALSGLQGATRMCHILIIEDEPLVAMAIQDILESEGATSFAIVDTEKAAVTAAMANAPQIITSDVKLLNGTGRYLSCFFSS